MSFFALVLQELISKRFHLLSLVFTCSPTSRTPCPTYCCASYASCATWYCALRPHVLSCSAFFVSSCSCDLRASFSTCSYVSCASCLASYCASDASFPVCSRAPRASCLMCFVPYLLSYYIKPFFLRIFSASCLK